MQQLFQDAMANVHVLVKLTSFITITCNPKWPEIVAQLEDGQVRVETGTIVQCSGSLLAPPPRHGSDQKVSAAMQTPTDRPDIIARVFN